MNTLERLTLNFLAGLLYSQQNKRAKSDPQDRYMYTLVLLCLAVLALMAMIGLGVTS